MTLVGAGDFGSDARGTFTKAGFSVTVSKIFGSSFETDALTGFFAMGLFTSLESAFLDFSDSFATFPLADFTSEIFARTASSNREKIRYPSSDGFHEKAYSPPFNTDEYFFSRASSSERGAFEISICSPRSYLDWNPSLLPIAEMVTLSYASYASVGKSKCLDFFGKRLLSQRFRKVRSPV